MKLNNQPYRTVALLLLVLLAAACTGEDDFATLPDEGTANAAPLTITVTDGAYAPAQSPDSGNTPDTRAVERGYATEFTKGDKIGLYVLSIDSLSRRQLLCRNLSITYNGTEWTIDSGEELPLSPHWSDRYVYFAYYPYQPVMEDGKIDKGAVDSIGVKTEKAHFFFSPLIKDWTPAADQSSYKAYTASDLMVGKGSMEHHNGVDGLALNLKMEHQMALTVIRMPTTKNTYTETIGGVETEEKSYRLYSGVDFPGWLADDNTYRYLVNPNTGGTIKGSYYNASLEKRSFDVQTPGNSPGQYSLRTIDGGEEAPGNRPLQVGDFYMKDGTIIPNENVKGNMPADVRADCLGVVFWVGENEGLHWTQTGYNKGDHLLMRDHLGCVHGMVVALRDASPGSVWAEGSGASEGLYKWANDFDSFNAEEQADWSAISESDYAQYGYYASHLVKLYSTHHPSATFPAYDTISGYAALHPAPGSSSGWFLPGRRELAMMCYGKASNYAVNGSKERRDLLNDLFQKAGGEKLVGRYWSSVDHAERVWCLDFDGVTSYGSNPKSDNNKVRAVLAF